MDPVLNLDNGVDPDIANERLRQCLFDTSNEKSRRRNMVFKNRVQGNLSDADYEGKKVLRMLLDEASQDKKAAQDELNYAKTEKQCLRDAYQKVTAVAAVPVANRTAEHQRMLDEAEVYIGRAQDIKDDYAAAGTAYFESHEAESKIEKKLEAESKRLTGLAETKSQVTCLGDKRFVGIEKELKQIMKELLAPVLDPVVYDHYDVNKALVELTMFYDSEEQRGVLTAEGRESRSNVNSVRRAFDTHTARGSGYVRDIVQGLISLAPDELTHVEWHQACLVMYEDKDSVRGRALRQPMSHRRFSGAVAVGQFNQKTTRTQPVATAPAAKKAKFTQPNQAQGGGTGPKGGPRQDAGVATREIGSVTFNLKGQPKWLCGGHKKRCRHHPSLCLMIAENQTRDKEELDRLQKQFDDVALKEAGRG